MELGILTDTIKRHSIEETFQAIQSYHLRHVQLDLSSVGLPTLPERIDVEAVKRINLAAEEYDINISAVSGTFNMAHPDEAVREEGLKRLQTLAVMTKSMGSPIITLCTGSRDEENMWRWHPDNQTEEAWHDMSNCLEQALKIAKEHEIVLAIETEASNVVNSAKRCKEIIDQMQSPYLKVIMDGANLFQPNQYDDMQGTIQEGFDLLGDDIVLSHAKDIAHEPGLHFVAAGEGILDYAYYLSLLSQDYDEIPLIMHGLSEDQISKSISFIQEQLGRL
ncbi:sugar phosphate isomerase/epimerase family protein [Gracilibacillus alcaliphilus]|uniref:sugar phosphate isomerase/epimerase family protein n=1 Tax=Gracilibacillus alcaliphilus TaxID=1401441 RepID=UPI0019583FA1|nr:sugar phosphate isomerase/epimerase family protein [Gracilibacillus alcaliphilus]MBM7677482.1 sugar phosphate isomerase/epimerase [Gracilibacillus alcaliphilus]